MYVSSKITIGTHTFEQASDHSCRELAFSAIRGSFWNETVNRVSLKSKPSESAYSYLYGIHSSHERSHTNAMNDYYWFRFALMDATIKSPISGSIEVYFSMTKHSSDIKDIVELVKAYNTVEVEYVINDTSWNQMHGIKLTGNELIFPAFFWAAKQFRDDEWSVSALNVHKKMNDMSDEQRLFVAKFMIASNEGPQDACGTMRNATFASVAPRIKLFANALDAAGGVDPRYIV